MEDLSKQLQTQQTLKFQKQSEERQQLMKFFEEKQIKLQKDLNQQRDIERIEIEEKREKVQKELNEKILEILIQAEKKLELLTKVIANKDNNDENKNVFSQSAICSALETFQYVPEKFLTFEAYFRRFGDVFNIECKSWSKQMKVHLLLQKLGAAEHNKFVDVIIH